MKLENSRERTKSNTKQKGYIEGKKKKILKFIISVEESKPRNKQEKKKRDPPIVYRTTVDFKLHIFFDSGVKEGYKRKDRRDRH